MATPDTRSYNKLVEKLRELFELDKADLDFGIYRIIAQRQDEIEDFLSNRLKSSVAEVLVDAQGSQQEQLQEKLAEAVQNAKQLGVDPESTPGVKELREQLSASGASQTIEYEVYEHLYRFFSRYYEEGDFISQRRVSRKARYAIPYNGEEVKLHWANADQYYIKSSENFRDYRFKLPDGRKVNFKLTDANTSKDNTKGDKRFFRLIDESPFTDNSDELVIHFHYSAFDEKKVADVDGKEKAPSQKIFNSLSLQTLTSSLPDSWLGSLAVLQPTKANANRTLLAKHLNDYTAKNSFDYFIHKDLGGFLRQELDFYIKNEVMFLDDIEDAEVPAVESYLRSIKAIRKVAGKVVDFLAQIENFQKKLWLKKKFVVRCGYCVTLDRVPKEFYSQICANSEQLDEWISLGVVRSNEQVDKEYLEANDRLCIDTAHFAEETRRELIEKIMAQSSSPNGLVIHSENFHAIKAIENTYRGKINTVYIDPPYNTGNDGFIYKDGYSSSSWLSMQESRLRLVKQLLCEKGSSFWANIDDNEAHNFKLLLDAEFGSSCFVASNVWQKRYSRENREAIGDSHEYLFTYSLDVASFKEARGRIPLEEKQLSLYKNPDKDPKGKWQSVSLTAQGFRKNQMYGITAPNGQTHFPPPGSCWKIVEEKYLQEVENGSIYFGKDGNGVPRRKNYLKDSVGLVPWTWWPHSEVGHTDEAKKEFYSLLGTQTGFDTPKPVRLLQRVADIALSHDGIILDYFAGSGTTAHAIINRNRADGGNREYILVEQGTYFDTVLKPRIQKVIYSENWKDGKPVTKDENSDNPYNGVSHCFKYMKLESYEDTLNNLQLERSNERDDLLSQNPDVREDFLLNYMLDIEAEGALLNVEAFTHPFDYQMHIATDSAGEMHKQNVDLVETFNYLLGLQVHTQRKDFVHVPCTQDEQGNWQRDRNAKSGGKAVEGEADVFTFLTIDGTMPDGQSALVVWRVLNDFESADSKTRHNIALDYFLMERKRINPREGELDLIYVNGDNTLPNIRAEEEHWKVRLIEEEFHRLMFAEDD